MSCLSNVSISQFLIVNFILTIGAITGCAVWAWTDDLYTLGSGYNFYWFVSVLSLIVSVSGMLYHFNYTRVQVNSVLPVDYRKYVMPILTVVMILFWLITSSVVADYTRGCLYIKNTIGDIYNYYESTIYESNIHEFNIHESKNYKCYGEIITTTFGFANFLLWVCISIWLWVSFQSQVPQPQIEQPQIEQPQVEEQSQVQESQVPKVQ
jgi:hypothetical protein